MIGRLLAMGCCVALAAGAADRPNSYRSATLTGCLDEQPGPQYVLRGVIQLKLIAKLEPEGFPVQEFANGPRPGATLATPAQDEPLLICAASL